MIFFKEFSPYSLPLEWKDGKGSREFPYAALVVIYIWKEKGTQYDMAEGELLDRGHHGISCCPANSFVGSSGFCSGKSSFSVG
jgi:hypothetical protein